MLQGREGLDQRMVVYTPLSVRARYGEKGKVKARRFAISGGRVQIYFSPTVRETRKKNLKRRRKGWIGNASTRKTGGGGK